MNQGTGALALVGSGEYSLQMQELESKLLLSAIERGKKNTFIQIPTASSHEGQSRRDHWRELGRISAERIGATWSYLPIHEREDALNPDFLREVDGAGLIYFSGGDPHRIVDVFRDTPLWSQIVRQWETGSSLAGCSAGAMAFGGTIMGLRRSIHSHGLGLLPEMEVIPHYDKMLGWLPDRVTSFIARAGADTTLIGIDEDTALIHTDAWRTFGRGRVHLLRGSLEIKNPAE